jgi:hypothetical protein
LGVRRSTERKLTLRAGHRGYRSRLNKRSFIVNSTISIVHEIATVSSER